MSAGAVLRRKRPARKPTYPDVLNAPPHMVAEIIKGAMHLQPRPANSHALAGPSLSMAIGSPFRGRARRLVDRR